MAIAIDQSTIGQAGPAGASGTIAFTTSAAVAAGGFIVVAVGWYGVGITLSSVAGGGLTWAVDVQGGHALANDSHVAFASAQAPSGLASSTTITATMSGSADGRAIWGTSLTGVATSSPVDVVGTVTGGGDTTIAWTTNNLSIAAGSVIFGCAVIQRPSSASTPTAGTETHEFATGGGDQVTSAYRIEASAGSYAVAGTWSLDGYCSAIGAAYKVATGAAQALAPSADSVDGNWTDQSGGTSLAAAIDEATASDADYIRSELGPQSSGSRVKLAAGGDPAVSTGHEINWRIAKDTAAGQTINMTVKLYQGGGNSLGGGTLIADFDRNDVSNTFTDYAETLSGGEADAITDYTDLYLEFWADVP